MREIKNVLGRSQMIILLDLAIAAESKEYFLCSFELIQIGLRFKATIYACSLISCSMSASSEECPVNRSSRDWLASNILLSSGR